MPEPDKRESTATSSAPLVKASPVPFKGTDDEVIWIPSNEPNLLTIIGSIAIRWSVIEMLLSSYYATLVFKGKPESRGDARWTVIAAFESLPTWQTKCNLMRDAAERQLGKDSAKELSKLLGGFESVQKRRNHAIHGRWFKSPSLPADTWVRRRGYLGPGWIWDAGCFKQLNLDIVDATNRLGDFFTKVEERLKREADESQASLQAALEAIFAPQQKQDATKGDLGTT